MPLNVENIIKLHTEAGLILFYTYDITKTSISLSVSIQIDERLRKISIESGHFHVKKLDLCRFLDYIKETALCETEILEADTFIPEGLEFQFTTLNGEVISSEYSYCSINFMINIGAACNDFSNSYIGIETVVLINELQHFYDKLNALKEYM